MLTTRSCRWLAGVDGRRGGWAVVLAQVLDDQAVRLEWHDVDGQDANGFAAVLRLVRSRRVAAVGVDCPIGLPEDRWRRCDLLAKSRLGSASARVFLAPPREVLAAPSYADARVIARRLLDGKGISAQTYGIRRMVLAVDEALRTGAGHETAVLEVHPELSFMALTGRAPGDPLPSKKHAIGRRIRLDAVRGWLGPGVPLEAPPGYDHVDALAAAWSASRWVADQAEHLGDEVDRHGLPMRIVI